MSIRSELGEEDDTSGKCGESQGFAKKQGAPRDGSGEVS